MMEMIGDIIKGVAGFCAVLATGYCTMGVMCVLYGGMTFAQLPEWWWGATAVTAACLAYAALAGLRWILMLRWERQEARRLGYVRIQDGKVVYRK